MEFLEIPLFDDDFYKLCIRFLFNVVFLAIIVALAIYPNQRDREFAFTAVMMNVTVFFICFTLKKFELGLGMALGLFAIFGILRYRTDSIRPKEMTYLFIVIGLAVINALSNKKTSYTELIAVNCFIIAAALLKEKFVARGIRLTAPTPPKKSNGSPKLKKTTVQYDQLELLGPERREDLMRDLIQRTGLPVRKVQIQQIDLLQGQASLTVSFEEAVSSDESPENGGTSEPSSDNPTFG